MALTATIPAEITADPFGARLVEEAEQEMARRGAERFVLSTLHHTGGLGLREEVRLLNEHPDVAEELSARYRQRADQATQSGLGIIDALRRGANVFRDLTEELGPITRGLGTRVSRYARVSERDPQAPRWESTTANFPVAGSGTGEQTRVADEAPEVIETPDWVMRVLTRRQRRQIKAAQKAGTALNPWELLSPQQERKASRGNVVHNRIEERREERNEELRAQERLAHEKRKRGASGTIGATSVKPHVLIRPVF